MLPEDVAAMDLPLPRNWKSNLKAAFHHAAAFAHTTVTCSRGWAADSPLVTLILTIRFAKCFFELKRLEVV